MPTRPLTSSVIKSLRAATVSTVLLTILSIFVSIMLFSSSVYATEVYSWVDENGVQHFSGQPPKHDNYERITLRDRGISRAAARRPAQQPQQPAETVVSQEETVITTPDRTVTVIDPEVIAANCNRARNNLDLVNSRRRIVLTGDDGEPRRLNDDERLALISESQSYIDENCI